MRVDSCFIGSCLGEPAGHHQWPLWVWDPNLATTSRNLLVSSCSGPWYSGCLRSLQPCLLQNQCWNILSATDCDIPGSHNKARQNFRFSREVAGEQEEASKSCTDWNTSSRMCFLWYAFLVCSLTFLSRMTLSVCSTLKRSPSLISTDYQDL